MADARKPKRKKTTPEFTEMQKILQFDQAMARLTEAGLADEFVAAIQKHPELQKSLEKMAPKAAAAAKPISWSCCITVDDPNFP